MFFIVSKILGWICDPWLWVLTIGVTTAFCAWRGWSRAAWLWAAWGAFLWGGVSYTPVAEMLLRPLESRYSVAHLPQQVRGIVVLGGAEEPMISAHHKGTLALNERAERVITALSLALRYPQAQLIFSGGSGRLLGAEFSEAQVNRGFARMLNFPLSRITFEERSRNTWENLQFSQALLRPQAGETWLLVTSAAHMPRAMGIARRLNWKVLPIPCDYRTPVDMSPALRMRLVREALHEWLGLATYHLMGKTDRWLP